MYSHTKIYNKYIIFDSESSAFLRVLLSLFNLVKIYLFYSHLMMKPLLFTSVEAVVIT